MGGLECVITGLMDEFSIFFKEKKYAREIFTLIVIMTSFSVALINVTPVSSLYKVFPKKTSEHFLVGWNLHVSFV